MISSPNSFSSGAGRATARTRIYFDRIAINFDPRVQ